MGWPVTNWANADWAAIANINAFIAALNERKAVLGQAAGSLKSVGDDVQEASFWAGIQGWIGQYCGSFVISHSAGSPLSSGCYDCQATIPMYDLASLFSAAGLATSTWRRYTTHSDDGGSNLGGTMQAGDIIGPWIFEDIQKCLNVMAWSALSASNGNQGADDDRRVSYSDPPKPVREWDVVKNEAIEDWYWNEVVVSDNKICSVLDQNLQQGWRIASLFRGHPFFQTTIPTASSGMKKDIDWYGYTIKESYSSNPFDSQGDGVSENAWCFGMSDNDISEIGSFRSTNRWKESRYGTYPPNWPPLPTGNIDGDESGYKISSMKAVFRWNVSGGFEYV